jgi:hypothetical protein
MQGREEAALTTAPMERRNYRIPKQMDTRKMQIKV